MKKIPVQLIKDYIFVSLAFVVMLIFIHPAFCQNFKFEDSLDMNMVAQTLLLLLASLILAEVVVTHVLRFPFSYYDDIYTRLQHFLYCGGVCLLISTTCLNQLIAIIDCGFEHWYYAWTDHAGTFTLKWFVMTLPPCASRFKSKCCCIQGKNHKTFLTTSIVMSSLCSASKVCSLIFFITRRIIS